MKKKILTFMLLLVIAGVVMIAGHEIGRHMHKAEQNIETTEASVDYSLYYTYEDVEKVVSYLADTKAESEALSRLIDPLKKSEVIDVAFVKSVAQTIQVKASIYEEALNGKKDSDYVTKAEFEDFYERIVASATVKGLLRKDVLVLAISEEDKTSFFDGQDTYNAEFEIDESYEGNVLDVYMKNGKIFKINRLGDTQITLQNVWVESVTDGIIIYDNPVGVLTNNPPFDKQMFNLNNYMHLSNKSQVWMRTGRRKPAMRRRAMLQISCLTMQASVKSNDHRRCCAAKSFRREIRIFRWKISADSHLPIIIKCTMCMRMPWTRKVCLCCLATRMWTCICRMEKLVLS